MGCGNSRKEHLNYLCENRNIKTQESVRRTFSIRVSSIVKHNKGLYIVSEVAASQEFSKRNSSHDPVKLFVSKENSNNLTV
ncbi:hypothetical protein SteCoe_37935 [Stentor coeruleus]|uniref:Uncharacterized protein n=1 Tax=Stentor coeruleus TaxID=5963 RepID=A0A1R2AM60_9CILI|nr:hypothetical protein SteCoe_37935 [Stentor coeruleus]